MMLVGMLLCFVIFSFGCMMFRGVCEVARGALTVIC